MEAGAMPTPAPLVQVHGLRKSFGGVAALRGADLDLYAGEIHGLLGENGAGKSTLLKTLAGVHRADGGEITLGGVPFEQGGPRRSIEQGIAVIYQGPGLFPGPSPPENVLIRRQPSGARGGGDRAAKGERTAALFAQLAVRLDPDRKAEGLS